MPVRFAKKDESDRVNELRRQVHELHAAGRPDIYDFLRNAEPLACFHPIVTEYC